MRSGSPVFAAVAWMARHHALPVTEAALNERLPAGYAEGGAEGLARALDAVGLKSRLLARQPMRIDPGSLPAILFTKGGAPRILVGIDEKKRIGALLDPETGEAEELGFAELRRGFEPRVLLTAPKVAATSTRLSPEARGLSPEGGHWLWSELARHKGAWVQVVVAALGVNLAGLALPIFIMNVFDRVIPNLAFVTLVTLAIGVALALALDLILRLLRGAIIQRVSRRADLAMASHLFGQAMSQRLLARKGGSAAAITNLRDLEFVRDFFTSSTLVSLIDLAFVGVFLGVLALIVGPLAWVPTIAIPIILIIAFLAQVPIGRSVQQAQQMNVKRNVVLIEAMTGLETVKSVGAEPVMQREWENAVAASSRVSARMRNWSTFAFAATAFIQQAVSVGIIVWGVFLVSAGTVTLGALIAANILAGRVLAPLAGIAQTVFRANMALSAKRSIDGFVETEVERRDTLRSDLRVRDGKVTLQNVTFTYPGTTVSAVTEFSAEFAPGSTTALLGRIGSGKSTLGKLINGLYSAEIGSILIDGHEIAQFEPAELRQGIGYLPQDPVLFTGTLRENLLIGTGSASDDEIMRALYIAGIDGFVAGLPQGLNFFAGEKGERLSGGQRQALALARVLLRRPKFLFLDEPTNAMDHQTEALVIERLQELQREGTGMILSTHRMSLADIAPRFIVIEKGRKVIDGPKAEVIARLSQPAPRDDGADG
ncbi:type I secretion system permease/ATPase [Rhodophyticola sp. MJ-SS7]|nr:type I secretion system permease/ATPase [Rhodophyticola sp. MJ-SS7]